jgi:Rieske Fe-S protein
MLLDVTGHGAKHSKDCRRRYRSIKPELLVLVGICTHRGCSPQAKGAEAKRISTSLSRSKHRAEISHARAQSLGKRIPNRKGHHCVDRRSRRRID